MPVDEESLRDVIPNHISLANCRLLGNFIFFVLFQDFLFVQAGDGEMKLVASIVMKLPC